MSVSAADFYKSDSQLAAQLSSLEFEKYSQIASKESIQAAKVALELKKHVCHVVSNSSEALELIKKIVPDGKSVMNAASTTLAQIGLIDYLKNQSKWNNLHPAILAEKDPAKGWALRCQALLADFYFSSVSAVTEDGGFIACDLSGTRIGAFAQAGIYF